MTPFGKERISRHLCFKSDENEKGVQASRGVCTLFCRRARIGPLLPFSLSVRPGLPSPSGGDDRVFLDPPAVLIAFGKAVA